MKRSYSILLHSIGILLLQATVHSQAVEDPATFPLDEGHYDLVIPSKAELFAARANVLGFNAFFTGDVKSPEFELLIDPVVSEVWQFMQPVPFSQAKRVHVEEPVQRYTPDQMLSFLVKHLDGSEKWKPLFIVVHNTWNPTLDYYPWPKRGYYQPKKPRGHRPNGFSKAEILDMADRYGKQLRWRAGPAAFVDDKGIWLMNGFRTWGRHSPSWNDISWGIEQLGDYSDGSDAYNTGRGAAVSSNTVSLVSMLCVVRGFNALDPEKIRLHKEDPKTDHTNCPGDRIDKSEFMQRVHAEIPHWTRRWRDEKEASRLTTTSLSQILPVKAP